LRWLFIDEKYAEAAKFDFYIFFDKIWSACHP